MRSATLKWLTYEASGGQSEGIHSAPFEVYDEQPVIPEPLMWLRRLRAFSTLLYEGAYLDQPYVFMRELEAARDAELEFKMVQQRNLENKLKEQEQRQQQKGVASAFVPFPYP